MYIFYLILSDDTSIEESPLVSLMLLPFRAASTMVGTCARVANISSDPTAVSKESFAFSLAFAIRQPPQLLPSIKASNHSQSSSAPKPMGALSAY